MNHLLLISLCAFLVAAGSTPVMRWVAFRCGMLDQPARHKAHATPTPLLGGVAIYVAVVGALLMYHNRREVVQLISIFCGATWMSLWGLWDDRNGLRAEYKVLIQLIATTVVMASGIRVHLPLPEWLELLITLGWILGITNALNLLDNVDGLCGGIGAVTAGVLWVFAALNGQYLVGALAAALLGACLGFLLYNFNPARIFMGDTGSLFLGFMLAILGIKLRFPSNVAWVTWMIPVGVMGVPIFDTTLVVVSRLRRGKNPFTTPGQDHLSHRLLRLGWTPRGAVLLHYLVTALLGVWAYGLSLASVALAYGLGATVCVVALVALYWFEWRYPVLSLATTSEGV